MKLFNTIEELWGHCLFCPICNDNCRDIHVSAGPDDNFKLISFKKNDEILQLKCSLHLKKLKYVVDYKINSNDNTFKAKVFAPKEVENSIENPLSTYFYFYIQSTCNKCGYSYCNGSDIEFDQDNQKVVSIGIEREGIYLIDHTESFHVTLEYDKNLTNITKCIKVKDKDEIRDLPLAYQCPLIKVNMKEPQKAIRRIKTVLTFG